MSDAPSPVVAILLARRADLVGGSNSIGVQEGRVAELAESLTAAKACLAGCVDELAEIDRAVAILSPDPEPTPDLDAEVAP